MSDVLFQVFGWVVGAAIPLASFVAGLRSTDPLWLAKRPGLLGRSLLAILVIVPLVTVALVEWLAPDDVYVRAGIVVSILSIGIGPPNLMKDARARNDAACYEVGLNFALMVLAIVFMPAAVALHGAVFEHSIELPAWRVAQVVFLQALLPFAAGILFVRLWPKGSPFAERWAERFVSIVLAIIALLALVVGFRGLAAVGIAGWLTCVTIAMVAVVIGHWLGGPSRGTRHVLAFSSSTRFPGLALLLVSVVPGAGPVLVPVVLAYVISSSIVFGVYRAAMARRQQAEPLSAGAR